MTVYGLQADQTLNKGSQLYIPGQTKMGAGDVFLGGTGTGVTDAMLGGASRIAGYDAQGTQNAYNSYQANQANQIRQAQSGSMNQAPYVPGTGSMNTSPYVPGTGQMIPNQGTTYGLAADVAMNPGSQLYTPGQKFNSGDIFLGGSGTGITDAMLGSAQRIAGYDAQGTANAYKDYQAAHQNPVTLLPSPVAGPSSTDALKQAQAATSASTKAAYDAQLAAQIGTYNTQRSAIPAQTTVNNNQASQQGMANADHIRNALSQMGLLQSGESASQQLTNDVATGANINANNLQGQALDAGFADKIVAAQAQNGLDYNNAVRQQQQVDNQNAQWQQGFDQQGTQNKASNSLNQSLFDGYWHGQSYMNGIVQPTDAYGNTGIPTSKVYGLAADIAANPGKDITLYTPGQTQLTSQDVFLGGTGTGVSDSQLNGAQRLYGNTAGDTAQSYRDYMTAKGGQSTTGVKLPSSIASNNLGATNIVKTANGYSFTTAAGVPTHYYGS